MNYNINYNIKNQYNKKFFYHHTEKKINPDIFSPDYYIYENKYLLTNSYKKYLKEKKLKEKLEYINLLKSRLEKKDDYFLKSELIYQIKDFYKIQKNYFPNIEISLS